MSVWKKVSKYNQKQHRERHQPQKRSHLGLLQKHKDYVKRAKDYHKKERILKKLRGKALNKNSNEYYHHMVNSQLRNDIHFEKPKTSKEHSFEQKLILESKNLSYVTTKFNAERKKVEKFKSELHLIDIPLSKTNIQDKLCCKNISALDNRTVSKINALKEKKYKEWLKRIQRKNQLAVIKNKMEVEKNLKNSKHSFWPKLISPGTKNQAAVYEWKYERKK